MDEGALIVVDPSQKHFLLRQGMRRPVAKEESSKVKVYVMQVSSHHSQRHSMAKAERTEHASNPSVVIEFPKNRRNPYIPQFTQTLNPKP